MSIYRNVGGNEKFADVGRKTNRSVTNLLERNITR